MTTRDIPGLACVSRPTRVPDPVRDLRPRMTAARPSSPGAASGARGGVPPARGRSRVQPGYAGGRCRCGQLQGCVQRQDGHAEVIRIEYDRRESATASC